MIALRNVRRVFLNSLGIVIFSSISNNLKVYRHTDTHTHTHTHTHRHRDTHRHTHTETHTHTHLINMYATNFTSAYCNNIKNTWAKLSGMCTKHGIHKDEHCIASVYIL